MSPTVQQPTEIHGFPVLDYLHALSADFVSITTDINSETEKPILAGVAQHRNPKRTCWVKTGMNSYQLFVKRADLSIITE